MDNRTCTVDGCASAHHARGWCSRHYSTWRRTGDPTADVVRHYRTPAASFAARTRPDGECLVWTGSRTRDGYGFISVDGRLEMVHRYAWIAAHGPIPAGHEVDHTCLRRSCCNVKHLRLASRHENMRNRNGAQSTSRTGVRNVRAEGDALRVVVAGRHIGTFRDMASAKAAAEVARLARFGEYAGRG